MIDGAELELGGMSTAELSRWFPSTELVHIGDEIADGVFDSSRGMRPLALFDGPRTDFSLARLRHYTGTPPEHFQQFVLFTNYVRYVDEFVRFAIDALRQPDSPFVGFSVPGGVYRAQRPCRCRGADRRRRLAAAPDAGLSSDDRQRRRRHPGQHRRRPVATPRPSATISPCFGPRPG